MPLIFEALRLFHYSPNPSKTYRYIRTEYVKLANGEQDRFIHEIHNNIDAYYSFIHYARDKDDSVSKTFCNIPNTL
jgi:hypothetical protein